MAKFHLLTVSGVQKETDDCVTINFLVPDNLKEEYAFIQGQYLTLKIILNGEELRRTYSICSSPLSDIELTIAVKRMPGGKVSNYLFDTIKKGDSIEVMTPMGNFYAPLNPAQQRNYLMFAGGSGITPVFSLTKTILQSEPASKITLFYANRNEHSIIFKKKLDILEKYFFGRLKILHLLEKPHKQYDKELTGIMTKQKAEELIRKYAHVKTVNEFFICGPPPMMENVKEVLERFNVDKELIHLEYFSTMMAAIAKEEKAGEIPGRPLTIKVTVILDGADKDFEIIDGTKTILEAALENGLDAPYACRAGVCSTCKAKLLEGKVEMDNNFSLTQSEVANGFILTCQSHPTTEKIIASYDEI